MTTEALLECSGLLLRGRRSAMHEPPTVPVDPGLCLGLHVLDQYLHQAAAIIAQCAV